jgi:hypothetical protein
MPEVKLIVVLREPAERAISHYHHRVRAGREVRPLEAVFSREMLDRWKQGEILAESDSVYLERGCYAKHLRNWLKVFPPESLLVIKAESMFADTNEILSRTHRFLELSHEPLAEGRVFNQGQRNKKEPQEKEVLVQLREVYKAANAELQAIDSVGFDWECPSSANG